MRRAGGFSNGEGQANAQGDRKNCVGMWEAFAKRGKGEAARKEVRGGAQGGERRYCGGRIGQAWPVTGAKGIYQEPKAGCIGAGKAKTRLHGTGKEAGRRVWKWRNGMKYFPRCGNEQGEIWRYIGRAGVGTKSWRDKR